MTRGGNRFFTHLRVALRVLCLLLDIAAPVASCAQEIYLGGEEILSTSHRIHVVVLQGPDTVCVYMNPDGSERDVRSSHIYQRVRGSSQWDSLPVPVYEGEFYSYPHSLMAGVYIKQNSSQTERDTVAMWMGRTMSDIRHMDVNVPGSAFPRLGFIRSIKAHPYNRSVAIVVQSDSYADFQTSSITTDGGVSWRRFNPPSKASDFDRIYDYGFDASRPNRIYIGMDVANPRDPGPGDFFRTVYTDDWGVTYRDTTVYFSGSFYDRFTLCRQRGLGIWSGAGGLWYQDTTNGGGGGSHWFLDSDSLFLEPGQPPRKVRLPWLENARRDLAPNFDATTDRFVYDTRILAYHQQWPNILVTGFYSDVMTDTGITKNKLLAMSNDFGTTWRLLARIVPHPEQSIRDNMEIWMTAIDPAGPHVYATFAHGRWADNSSTKFTGSAKTILWRNVPTSVHENESPSRQYLSGTDVSISPNPASGSSALELRIQNAVGDVVPAVALVYHVNGSLCAVLPNIILSGNTASVALPGLATGAYILVLHTPYNASSCRFVVLD